MTIEAYRRNNFLFDDKISTNKKIVKYKIKILNNISLHPNIYQNIKKKHRIKFREFLDIFYDNENI